MPVPSLKKFAEQSGKSLADAEKAWGEAKEAADKQYKESDPQYWGTVTTITKNKLGIGDDAEKKTNP